jgi:hypothetical protein
MPLFPVLARQIRTVSSERGDLRNAVLHTWANHFPVSQTRRERLTGYEKRAFSSRTVLCLRVAHDVLASRYDPQENLNDPLRSFTVPERRNATHLALPRKYIACSHYDFLWIRAYQ